MNLLRCLPIPCVAVLITGCSGHTRDAEPAYDAVRDRQLMWETKTIKREGVDGKPGEFRVSSDAAIKAAGRVFDHVQPVGKTREDVIATLGDPSRSNDSGYNFSFYPTKSGPVMTYRFDNGCGGLQVDLYFDDSGKVVRVNRQWIE